MLQPRINKFTSSELKKRGETFVLPCIIPITSRQNDENMQISSDSLILDMDYFAEAYKTCECVNFRKPFNGTQLCLALIFAYISQLFYQSLWTT